MIDGLDPTCRECDTPLVDLDMAEDPDDPTTRWLTGRCPVCASDEVAP